MSEAIRHGDIFLALSEPPSTAREAHAQTVVKDLIAALRALSSAPPGEKVRVCPDGREFIIELATVMGVVDVGADPGTPVPVRELMESMLARAKEDRERWHSEPGEKGERIPSGWKLVPVEPTEAMLEAARDWSAKLYGKPIGHDAARGCFGTMLAASPPPAKAEDGMREVDNAEYAIVRREPTKEMIEALPHSKIYLDAGISEVKGYEKARRKILYRWREYISLGEVK